MCNLSDGFCTNIAKPTLSHEPCLDFSYHDLQQPSSFDASVVNNSFFKNGILLFGSFQFTLLLVENVSLAILCEQ